MSLSQCLHYVVKQIKKKTKKSEVKCEIDKIRNQKRKEKPSISNFISENDFCVFFPPLKIIDLIMIRVPGTQPEVFLIFFLLKFVFSKEGNDTDLLQLCEERKEFYFNI